MAEQAIFEALSAIPALGNRVYPLVLPDNVAYPAVVYQRIAGPRYSAMGVDVDVLDPTIQYDIYSHRDLGYAVFEDAFNAVRRKLQRMQNIRCYRLFHRG